VVAMKTLLRHSSKGAWYKLDPFEFVGPDGDKKLQDMPENSPDLSATEGGNPAVFFRPNVAIQNNEADLLGVDADGMIVMVECKVEANREAGRMVVGHIPEYTG